jgi:Tol biopolymer transport system component
MSIRDNGTWGEPQNLGKNINSAKNEMFPSLCKNATLVFSSNRNEEQGLDLYYSKDGARLQAISELNSTEDDFGLVIHKKGKLGYFTSNRSGADDIFKVELK